MVADLREVVAERRAALAAMDQAAFDADSITGLSAAMALDEISAVLGYVIGKKAGAPPGVSVRFELTGQLARRIDVAVSDRARVVVALTGGPTVTLKLAGARFVRMAGGRLPPGADTGARRDGDAALGELT